MSSIRAPAVAGTFYPEDDRELRNLICAMLAAWRSDAPAPKAIIVPHAGYIYSGPIAASAYAQVANGRNTITRVIMLGPSHRVPFYGLAASNAEFFTTPLGAVPVDREALTAIGQLRQVQTLDQAHQWEHSLEVHIPFLQMVLTEFKLVPLVVGEATAEEVGEVLENLWGGPETLIVVSSDLSHYHDYDTARRLDRDTSDAITHFRPQDIRHEQACGRNPILGLLLAARQHHMNAEILDLRNSGDTAGPRDRVVGYGAYTFI
ncbi:MAG: AmmeMemoRadiSam system protein B [Gammaproteobacteria bacterium]|jgi:AmmeMemoRadiSam system protein B